MTKVNGYKIDFTTGNITMTKAFAKRAGVYDTPEYNILTALQRDFPNIRPIIKAPPKRKRADNLTYSMMISFIECQRDSDILLKQFNMAKDIAKGQGGNSYQNTKRWFLQTFPDYKDIPKFNTNGDLISTFGYSENRERVISIQQPRESA